MNHSRARFSAATLIAAFALLILGVGRSQAPEDASVRVTSPFRAELNLLPDGAATYELTLANDGATAAVVDVTQADFHLDERGNVAQEPPGTLPASNATWLEVAAQVEVPANGTQSIPVTGRVPSDATEGSYWSLLLVTPRTGTTFEDDVNEGDVRTAVTVQVRYAVTVLTHVGEADERQLHFREPQLTTGEDPGTHALAVTIDNAGRFVAPTEVWLELYDQQGNLVDRFDADELRLYPGVGRRHTFQVGELGDAPHQAVIIADAGGEAVFGVRYDLDPTSDTD